MKAQAERVPATVLTGFLGSGKSTLLRRILAEPHGLKIAVVENEFGEENIDGQIIAAGAGEQIVQLSNGCICCSIRDDLRAALTGLMRRRHSGEIAFDRIVIETTGLADPGPVAQTFFLDGAVAEHYRPDAIITLVDAKFAMRQLDDRAEARRQVGFADRIFISKADLATREDMARLNDRLARMNTRAPRREILFGNIALGEVFDVGGFNLTSDLELAKPDRDAGPPCHDPAHAHAAGAHHAHHDDVQSFVFRADRPFHPGRFGQFLNAAISSHGDRLLRYKGVLSLLGLERKVILQGVHQLTSRDLGEPWRAEEARVSTLVFIGVDLPMKLFLDSLERCLA
jgi:G3E family GTPase